MWQYFPQKQRSQINYHMFVEHYPACLYVCVIKMLLKQTESHFLLYCSKYNIY